jgi:hypothetical protein
VGKDNGRITIGVIVRDHEREVLTTLIAPRPHIIDLAITRAMVALRVVFAKELGWHNVKVEGMIFRWCKRHIRKKQIGVGTDN